MMDQHEGAGVNLDQTAKVAGTIAVVAIVALILIRITLEHK